MGLIDVATSTCNFNLGPSTSITTAYLVLFYYHTMHNNSNYDAANLFQRTSLETILRRLDEKERFHNADAEGATMRDNTLGNTVAERLDFQLFLGVVILAYATDYRYTVQIGTPHNKNIDAYYNTGCATPFGVKEGTLIPAGTPVVVYWNGDMTQLGIILATIPSTGERFLPCSFSDLISNVAPGGQFQDAMHRAISEKIFAPSYNDNRPLDISSIGEIVWSSIFGPLLNISPTGIQIRAQTGCGIYMSIIDNMLRLTGKVLNIWTPSGMTEAYADNGESHYCEGRAAYDWEALGNLIRYDNINNWSVQLDNRFTGVDKTADDFSREPFNTSQQPFYRFKQYHGWLGQGELVTMTTLPFKHTCKWTHSRDIEKEPAHVGLFQQSVGMSGEYAVRSSHSIILERSFKIPVFERVKDVNDPSGDDADKGYKPNGEQGDNVKSLKAVKDGILKPAVTEALHVDDFLARENYKTTYPFKHHQKDFVQCDRVTLRDVTDNAPLFYKDIQKLRSQQFYERKLFAGEKEIKLHIDDLRAKSSHERTDDDWQAEKPVIYEEDVDYTEDRTGIYMLPSGGIVLRDVFGNELRSGPQGWEMFSASDIHVRPSRRCVVIAGDDLILTGNKSVDVTALRNDVRISAPKNMELVSGIDSGRMLIENKSKGKMKQQENTVAGEDIEDHGIILKARNAELATYSTSTYIRTFNEGASGQIVLDADKQAGKIIGIANTVSWTAQDNIQLNVHYGLNPAHQVKIVAGEFTSNKNLRVQQYIGTHHVEANHIVGNAVAAPHAPVLAKGYAAPQLQVDAVYDDYDFIEQEIYEEEKKGHWRFIEELMFTFRTGEQYGVSEDYVLLAPSWGAWEFVSFDTNDLGVMALAKTDPEIGTAPFPGIQFWTKLNNNYIQAYPQLYTVDDGNKYGMYKTEISEHSGVTEYSDGNGKYPAAYALPVVVSSAGDGGRLYPEQVTEAIERLEQQMVNHKQPQGGYDGGESHCEDGGGGGPSEIQEALKTNCIFRKIKKGNDGKLDVEVEEKELQSPPDINISNVDLLKKQWKTQKETRESLERAPDKETIARNLEESRKVRKNIMDTFDTH